MTVITYDRKSISVDSLVTSGDIRYGSTDKFIELPQGGFAFGCGGLGAIKSIFMALLESETPSPEHFQDSCIITLDKDGRVWEQDGSAHKERVMRPWAWGSGQQVALGALSAGANSRQAAEIAAKFETSCGGKIHTFNTR